MSRGEEDRPVRLELLAGGDGVTELTYTYPVLEDIVLRGLTARTDGGVLDQVCDVIVALEMAGVVEVAGRCYGPLSATSTGGPQVVHAPPDGG